MTNVLDPSLDKDVEQVMAEAPVAVKEIFAKDRIQTFVTYLKPIYKLTSLQTALLTREVALLILLLSTLEEFKKTLVLEGGLNKEAADNIYKELERRILKPLQGALLAMPMPAQKKQVRTESPQLKKPSMQVPLPSYAGAPPPQSPSYVRSEPKLPETYVAPMQPKAAMPRPTVTLGESRIPLSMPPPAMPRVSVPQAPPPTTTSAPSPLGQPMPPVMPAVAPRAELPIGEEVLPQASRAEQSLPGAMPPTSVPAMSVPLRTPQAPIVAPVSPPSPQMTPSPARQVPAPPAPPAPKAAAFEPAPRPAFDPYREPLEEKDLS